MQGQRMQGAKHARGIACGGKKRGKGSWSDLRALSCLKCEKLFVTKINIVQCFLQCLQQDMYLVNELA